MQKCTSVGDKEQNILTFVLCQDDVCAMIGHQEVIVEASYYTLDLRGNLIMYGKIPLSKTLVGINLLLVNS